MIETQTLAIVGVFALPVVWVLSHVNWSKLLKRQTVVAPVADDIDPAILKEAELFPGDYAALQRLVARATRHGNTEMYEALGIVQEQFWIDGDGWEETE